ncbi:MAG: IclR family transcriptional regulator [Roseiflexaceae bacterium]|nr:IclR family transcriptional regulator [Roseiflexaceae bacterium]
MKQLERNRYTIDALARGLEVLAVFSAARPSLTLAEIVALLGMNKSTIFRVVATLESLGFLEHDPTTRRYRPGLAVLQLGFAALSGLEMRQIAHPQLELLAEEFHETASLAVLDRDGRDIVYIDRVRNRAIVGVVLGVGSRVPAHTASLGKALLAELSDADLSEWLAAAPPRALTEQTLTSREQLMADLAATRVRGYAMSDQELAVGLRGAAAAIRDASGRAIAAVSVSGPAATLTLERIEQSVGPAVAAVAARISQALGG